MTVMLWHTSSRIQMT